MSGNPPLLELEAVMQGYGGRPVIDKLSLTLGRGKIGCLLGASGCGKTTILRCIAGFEPIAGGEIRLNGQLVSGHRHMAIEHRNVGFVFQDYALFPHLDVASNIAFGLHRMPSAESRKRTAELMETVGLTAFSRRYPHELSGGQQQRVALARALAPRPDLLLLDEPFSSLDVDLRERLGMEVRDILKQQGATALLVTHDQHEAFAMADEIGILAAGRLQQWDTAHNLYHRPNSRFVADFVGRGAFLQANWTSDGRIESELGICDSFQVTTLPPSSGTSSLDVLLRPEDIVQDDSSRLRGEVVHRAFRGSETLYTLRLPSGAQVLFLASSQAEHVIGAHVGVRLRPGKIAAFPK